MRQLLFIFISLLIGGCTKRQLSKTTFTVDADSISNGLTDSLSHHTEKEDILALDSTACDIDTISSSQTLNWVLEPIVQNELKGKVIPSDSLILRTEFELYPLSITEIKLFVQNFAQTKYTSGAEYSIAYYDATENKWEPLSVNPIRNDVLWVIRNELGDIPCQTICLYTNLMKNRPGKYRIRKLFNNDTLIAEVEFEMVDKPTEDGMPKNKISKRMHEFDSETDTVVNQIR